MWLAKTVDLTIMANSNQLLNTGNYDILHANSRVIYQSQENFRNQRGSRERVKLAKCVAAYRINSELLT